MVDENCGASPEIMGRHEEKLNNLEVGLAGIKKDVKETRDELRGDIRELISTMQKMFDAGNDRLEHRIEKLEDNQIESNKTLEKHEEKILGFETTINMIRTGAYGLIKYLIGGGLIFILAKFAQHMGWM